MLPRCGDLRSYWCLLSSAITAAVSLAGYGITDDVPHLSGPCIGVPYEGREASFQHISLGQKSRLHLPYSSCPAFVTELTAIYLG